MKSKFISGIGSLNSSKITWLRLQVNSYLLVREIICSAITLLILVVVICNVLIKLV